MASQINTSTINGSYPVAGQDNDSDGFRTNFTGIKNNFDYAKTEINELQSKGIFKSAITGTTLDNDLQGSILSNAEFNRIVETIDEHGDVSSSTNVDVSFNNGHLHTMNFTGVGTSISLNISDFPAGAYAKLRLLITNLTVTTYTATLLPNTNEWKNGDTLTIAPGTYLFELSSSDGETFYTSNLFTQPASIAGYQYANLAVSTNVTLGNVSYLILDNTAGSTASIANIAFQPNVSLVDGQKITITSNVAITSANLYAGTNTTILGRVNPGTWAKDSGNTWIFQASSGLWFKG
jgi:hypothetical protein